MAKLPTLALWTILTFNILLLKELNIIEAYNEICDTVFSLRTNHCHFLILNWTNCHHWKF